jgi:hypothetical protein
MSQKIQVSVSGLKTNSNQVNEDSANGLTIAQNVNIDKANLLESRRGFEDEAAFANSGDRADAITSYQDKLIVHRSNDSKMAYLNSGTWTDYSGTYSHPDNSYARMKFSQANGNLYFTSTDGVKVLDAYNGTIYSTGMPKGLDGEASLSGASGFMVNNTQVAYRIVWGAKDANNNLYLGAPSQRILVSNSSGGTRDVSLTFTIPSGITTSDFFQIYRGGASASSTSEPNDEMQIVYEANPTAGEITAKQVTVVDSIDESLKGAYLYSNANQEGAAETNDIPPLAHDITLFKNYTFFGNVKTKHYLDIKLLAVSGSGLVADDTITIDSMVFTAKSSTTVASRYFKVFTTGSVSQNIEDTAKELVKVINQYSSNTSIYAYYVSEYADLPGQILLERRSLTASSFTVSVSRAVAWDIDDGTSDNSEYQHGLMWSKMQQPEHVPTSHLEFIGSKNFPIRRILALKDSLFILKTDGVWRLTGNAGSWQIEPLDTSTKIYAPESAVVMNNQIFALADQGIVNISDLGVKIISIDIEDQLTELVGLSLTNLKTVSYGIAYETARKYILNTITTSSDTTATQSFVYNTVTGAWTTYNKESVTGFVNPTDDKLYLAKPDSTKLLKERKAFTYRDYIDEEVVGSFSIASFATTSLVLNTTAGLTVGDLLYQSSTLYSPIVSIDSTTNTVVVNDSKTWSIAAVTAYKGIDCQVEWVNQTGDNPGLEKQFEELQLLFREQQFNYANVSFYTDLSGGYESVQITGNYGGGLWGLFAWGSIPWGGISRPKPIRMFVPREKSRGTLLSVKFSCRVAYSKWSLNGFTLFYDSTSERSNKD